MPRPSSSLRKGKSEVRQECRSEVYFEESSTRKLRDGGRIEYRSRRTRETMRVSLMCSTGAIMSEYCFGPAGVMLVGVSSLSLTMVGKS